MNTYYPPVHICNNDQSNNTDLFNRQMNAINNGIVYQNIFQSKEYKIGTEYKYLTNNKLIEYNKKLYSPIQSNINIDSKLINLNTIYNKCGYHPNINKQVYQGKLNDRIMCIYPEKNYHQSIISKNLYHQNTKNKFNNYNLDSNKCN